MGTRREAIESIQTALPQALPIHHFNLLFQSPEREIAEGGEESLPATMPCPSLAPSLPPLLELLTATLTALLASIACSVEVKQLRYGEEAAPMKQFFHELGLAEFYTLTIYPHERTRAYRFGYHSDDGRLRALLIVWRFLDTAPQSHEIAFLATTGHHYHEWMEQAAALMRKFGEILRAESGNRLDVYFHDPLGRLSAQLLFQLGFTVVRRRYIGSDEEEKFITSPKDINEWAHTIGCQRDESRAGLEAAAMERGHLVIVLGINRETMNWQMQLTEFGMGTPPLLRRVLALPGGDGQQTSKVLVVDIREARLTGHSLFRSDSSEWYEYLVIGASA